MKYFSLCALVCLTFWSTSTQKAVGQPAQHRHEGTETLKHPSDIEGLISEFMLTAVDIKGRPGGEAPVGFPGPKDKPNYYQALVVTSSPLLDEECRKEALEYAVKSIGNSAGHGANEYNESLQAAMMHMQEHQDFIKGNQVSYAEYLEEISGCREFCGPLIAYLAKCHVLSVARHEHGIVLFALDSDYITSQYENGLIAAIAQKLRENSALRVLLIGRASKIGDLPYNRRLSGRRALAVKDKLVAKGIDESRIKSMWCGWEPPQIGEWMVAQYGPEMQQLFNEKGQQQMNQSVEMVLY